MNLQQHAATGCPGKPRTERLHKIELKRGKYVTHTEVAIVCPHCHASLDDDDRGGQFILDRYTPRG